MSYRADLDALAGLVDRMRGFDRRAQELADELSSEQRGLDSRWDGAASQCAASAHRHWARGHEQVRASLGALAAFVRTARANYAAAAEANSAMWR